MVDAPLDLSENERLNKLLETNEFRRDLSPASSSQPVWPLLVLVGGCLFFFDVFARRVTVNFDWVPPLAMRVRDRILGRQARAQVEVTIERLRTRKAEVADQLEQKRAALRFEPTAEATGDVAALAEEAKKAASTRPKQQAPLAPEQQGESYTERLLKAKKKAQTNLKIDKPEGGTDR